MTRYPCVSCSRELPAACGDCVMGLLLSLVNGLPVPTWGWSRLQCYLDNICQWDVRLYDGH